MKPKFEVGHGFDSCTKTFHAEQFNYNDTLYELIDSPGLFDTNSRNYKRVLDEVLRHINHYNKLYENGGISSFIIVIPYERLSPIQEEYFDFLMMLRQFMRYAKVEEAPNK